MADAYHLVLSWKPLLK